MKEAALQKAKARLLRASRALDELEAAETHQSAEDAWYDFLSSIGVIYNALEQGSKATDQSRKWFSRKKDERSADAAISFVLQARNADTHGVDSTTSRWHDFAIPLVPGQPIISVPEGESIWNTYVKGPDGVRRSVNPVKTDVLRLVPVTNRGVTYRVPSSHLGKEFTAPATPASLARLTITYLSSLLTEAEALTN